MSVIAPSPGRPLLVSSVLEQVRQTLQRHRTHFVRLTILAGSVPAVTALAGTVLAPIPDVNSAKTLDGRGFVFFSLLSVCAYLVAHTMLAVACHRCVLLAEQKMEFAEWIGRIVRYAWRVFIVSLATLVPTLIVYSLVGALILPLLSKLTTSAPPSPTFVAGTFLLGIVSFVPGLYFGGRLSLVLPAVTVDQELGLEKSWALTEGNGWRLAVLTGLIPIGLPTLVSGIFEYAFGAAVGSSSVLAWAFSILGIYFQTACLAVGVVILSTCFRELSEWDVANSPSAETGDT